MEQEASKGTEQAIGQQGQQTVPENTPAAKEAASSTSTAQTPDTAALAAPPAAGKTYTDEQLADLKTQWLQEQEQAKAQAKDFAQLTPKQQIEKLQADLLDRDLTDYARSKAAEAKLPPEALAFVKGKDQADTDTKIKAFSALLATGVQNGVLERFKQNGYTPRGSAASVAQADTPKRTRGVTYNERK